MALVTRYAKVHPFQTTSQQQVLAYLNLKGYQVPVHPKTRKPTTGKKAIAKLTRQHPEDPVLRDLRLIRGLSKVIGDLSDKYIHSDGRFHPIITLDVSTGRMAGAAPNLMNQSQGRLAEERERAQAQRSSIKATDGFILLSRDWKGSQAQLTAWFANDPSYARVSLLGAHAYYLSHLNGAPVDLNRPDPEVEADLAKIKKEDPRYPLAKAINLALPFGMGPYLLAEEVGCSFADACTYLMVHENMFPHVKLWKEQIRRIAHKEKCLRNPFGWTSPYYFDIFHATSKLDEHGQVIWEAKGKQANQVLAQQPQSTEAAMLKEVILDVDAQTRDTDDFHILTPLHDELVCEARIGTEHKYMAMLRKSMGRAWPELNGLAIDTEGKIGYNFAEYRAEDDPNPNPLGMRPYDDAAEAA
jgi:DNA polymerase-1